MQTYSLIKITFLDFLLNKQTPILVIWIISPGEGSLSTKFLPIIKPEYLYSLSHKVQV
jgi:hypothetical protein